MRTSSLSVVASLICQLQAVSPCALHMHAADVRAGAAQQNLACSGWVPIQFVTSTSVNFPAWMDCIKLNYADQASRVSNDADIFCAQKSSHA
jgi:hypothetical protein